MRGCQKSRGRFHQTQFAQECNSWAGHPRSSTPLGRFHIDWRTWVKESLVDGIRLNVDHRRFGYDDWRAASAETYRFAQERGVRVFIDCAVESRYDRVENPPKPLPISKEKDPDIFFPLMSQMAEKMLRSSADGVFFYEHAGNDRRTWEALAAAKRAAVGR